MSDEIRRYRVQPGESDRAIELDARTIMRVEVGSTAHGVTHTSNDIDEIAVYVPPPEEALGFDRPEVYVYRPGRAPHEPSGPGDLDRTYYSLRKFLGLLVKGNPSILLTLFAPIRSITPAGVELRALGPNFVTEHTRNAYLGYMEAQRQRITGERGAAGRIRRSPEGGGQIDWKYAMHMVRLGVQGYEYLTTGQISCPSLNRESLLEIRSGAWSLGRVTSWAEALEDEVRSVRIPAPSGQPDWNRWLARRHIAAWAQPEKTDSPVEPDGES